MVLMVVVFFKFQHPIDFSEVISKAGASLKIVSHFSFSFFFFFFLTYVTRQLPQTQAGKDSHIPPRKDSHIPPSKEPGTLWRKKICPEWTQIGRSGLPLPFPHAPEDLNLVYWIYCNDINMLQEQESSKRGKKRS